MYFLRRGVELIMHLNHIVPNRSRSGSEIFPRPIFCQIKLDAEEELMKFTYPRQAAILFIPSFQNVTQKVGIFFFSDRGRKL